MNEPFATVFTAGGASNSLGRSAEILEVILHDHSRIEELYRCLLDGDAWVRMRAADTLEKICRLHPAWIVPYIDRLQHELAPSTQPSIQWHLAQIYRQVDLTANQKQRAIRWLSDLVSTPEADWIVAANTMDTLAQFAKAGDFPVAELVSILNIQQQHKSKAVVKRATRLLGEYSTEKASK